MENYKGFILDSDIRKGSVAIIKDGELIAYAVTPISAKHRIKHHIQTDEPINNIERSKLGLKAI